MRRSTTARSCRSPTSPRRRTPPPSASTPGDDARALLPHLAGLRLVEVAFPRFRDGRGYSSAAILRAAGYTGELRAAGDVLLDQIVFLRRVGFDSLAPATPLDRAAVDAALARFPYVYQAAADGKTPAWALRHG